MDNKKDYTILSEKDFSGFRRVMKDNLYNLIDANDKLLLDEWFDTVYSFNKGFAEISNDQRKSNYVTPEGKLVFDEWFDGLENYSDDGFFVVEKHGNYAMMTLDGKYITDIEKNQFRYIYVDYYTRLIVCIINDKYNFLDKNGKLLFEVGLNNIDGFDDIEELHDYNCSCECDVDCEEFPKLCECKKVKDVFIKNFMQVELNGKYNLINKEGKLIHANWFDTIDYAHNLNQFIFSIKDVKYTFDGTYFSIMTAKYLPIIL